MVKQGFSLAELMVALLLASLLSLSLFQLLNQSRKVVRRIVNVIEVDEPLNAFYTQIEKDVIGMFAPQGSMESYAEQDKKEESAKKSPPNAQNVPAKGSAGEEKREETLPIKPVMVFDSSKERVYWSFITTGGISQLDTQGSLDPTPFLRRVAYILEPDPQRPTLRRLMYRFSKEKLQGHELQGAGFIPSYELLSGIKDISFEFTLIEVVKKEPGPPGSERAAATTSVLKEWNELEIWKKFKALIPAYVKIVGVVVDRVGKEYPFELLMKVPAYTSYKPKEETIAQRIERIASEIFGKKP